MTVLFVATPLLVRQAGIIWRQALLHQVAPAITRQVLRGQNERCGPLREVMGELLLLPAGRQGIFMRHATKVLAQPRAGDGGR